jgi:cytochrome c-type biogenesis protein
METLLNHLSHSLSENPFLAYLGVFIGGIFSSSSPCVLATFPLVIGYVVVIQKEIAARPLFIR